jgi:hypothetical protein
MVFPGSVRTASTRPWPPKPATIYGVLRPAGFSDEATVGIVYALLT